MIEFKGALSKETEKFILKEQKRVESIAWIITAFIFGIPIAVFSITVEPIFAIGLIVPLILLFSYYIPYGKSEKLAMLPEKISIDFEEGTIVFKSAKVEDFHMLSDIERIEDYGDWYYFRFSAGDKSCKYICQKDLTTEDELDEFRKQFEDLIITKK